MVDATEARAVTDRLQSAWDSYRPELPPIIFTDAEAAHLALAFAAEQSGAADMLNGECICPKCGIRHGCSFGEGGF